MYELGKVQGTTAKFIFPARPVPYALRVKVERELDCLQADGVIEPIQFCDWATPIVPVVKKDRSVRICGNYKFTINQAAKTDLSTAPYSRFVCLTGRRKTFSKLDLAHAYQQIPLDEQAKQYVYDNQHTRGAVPVQSSTICSCICPINFSMHDGKHPTRLTWWCLSLHRRYFGHWKIYRGTPS